MAACRRGLFAPLGAVCGVWWLFRGFACGSPAVIEKFDPFGAAALAVTRRVVGLVVGAVGCALADGGLVVGAVGCALASGGLVVGAVGCALADGGPVVGAVGRKAAALLYNRG